MMNQTTTTPSQLASASASKPLAPPAPPAPPRRPPNLPLSYLIDGPRKEYLRLGVPLFEASIRCDLNAVKAIIESKPELVRYSITENGETALHLAATVKRSDQHVESCVKYLVDMMEDKDLMLENKSYETALYIAAVAGNLETIKIMVERNKRVLTIRADAYMMPPLSVAALYGHYEGVKYLYECSNDLCDDDGWNLTNRGLLLEKCMDADMFDVALKIVKTYPQLPTRPVLLSLARKPEALEEAKSESKIITRFIDAVVSFTGLTAGANKKKDEALQLLKFIWEKIAKKHKNEIDMILRGPPDSENINHALPLQKLISEHLGTLDEETKSIMGRALLDKALKLQELISEHLENLDVETKKLIKQDDKRFFQKGDQTSELQKLIHDHVVNIRFEFQNIIKNVSRGDEDQASCMQKLIFKHITKMRALTGLDIKKYSSQIPFIAAEMGNTKFLIELIRRYPDLIWKVNDDKQTIFHIAVKYRHKGIYSLLYEMGSMKDLITSLRDVDDNNMLHLAVKMSYRTQLSVTAFHMHSEMLWFMEIRSTIAPYFREQKNKDGLTPAELFLEEQKELIRDGEKWIKDTVSQFMVAAALIATISFAAAFTVPGGFNQDNGIPIFYRKPIFSVFVVADAMSLILSSTSILTFLAIFTSHYTEFDFLESLPQKLKTGMSSLFLSILTMIITFSVSLFILYHKELSWIPILIGVFTLQFVLQYIVLQYPLLADAVRLAYSSKYDNFKPKKQYLYYVNPRV